MKRTGHPTAQAARAELLAAGYWPLAQPPSEAFMRWRKRNGKKRDPQLAVAAERRPRSTVWHIVEAPASAAT